ncbi:hypothetical protein FRC03_006258 [Tulasnella sp. 419]|nr:hypothetical protein FRC03_006258 [Tulasnella sp. 419]
MSSSSSPGIGRSINLPLEIWLMISELLSPTKKNLRSWLQVSRVLRIIAMPHVFRELRLSFCGEITSGPFAGQHIKQTRRSMQILNRIIVDTTFANNVRRITVSTANKSVSGPLCDQLAEALLRTKALVSFGWLSDDMELPQRVCQVLATIQSLRNISFHGKTIPSTYRATICNLHSLKVFIPAKGSQRSFTDIVRRNSSTLRHLILAPAPLTQAEMGPRNLHVVLPSSLKMDQLRHLTMHTWSPIATSKVFNYALNLTSLVIHLRRDIPNLGPSNFFRAPVAVAGLPNLKEFIFIISSNSTLHGIAYLTSVVDFVIVSAPNVERLWVDIPAPSTLLGAPAPRLQCMSKLKALRLDLEWLPPCVIMWILQAVPASLESIFIAVGFDAWAMVALCFWDLSSRIECDRSNFLPLLKHLVLKDTVSSDSPISTHMSYRMEVKNVVKLQPKLEIVGDGHMLYDVERIGEERQKVKLVPIDDIPVRNLHGVVEDRALSALEWVWRGFGS